MKQTYRYDHYWKYEEMEQALQTLAETYPSLMKLEVLNRTKEGRAIYGVTISEDLNEDRPAFYMDGCTHAGEVSGSMSCLYTIDTLLTSHDEERIAKLLKKQVFYFIPRISPDGTEEYLTTPNTVRSINEIYPEVQKKEGLHAEDLNGDHRILMMRRREPYGAWKKASGSEFQMVRREPDDTEGEFYSVYTEGMIDAYDGINVPSAHNGYGMDFNRNFPVSWQPEGLQRGAGETPLDHVETKTMADFIISHKNICAVQTMHTSGGVLFYPPGTMPEGKACAADMKQIKEIARLADHKLKYPAANLFETFAEDEAHFDAGAFDDWCYLNQGIPALTVEIWNIHEKAGCDEQYPVDRNKSEQKEAEENAKIEEWIRKNAPEAIAEWQAFEHPQLGEVEIGGIDWKFTSQNPPASFLAEELDKLLDFTLRFADTLPSLHFGDVKVTKETDCVYRLETSLYNSGFLPMWLSEHAKELKNERPVFLKAENCRILSGEKEIDALAGFAGVPSSYGYGGNIMTFAKNPAVRKLTWLVEGKAGDAVTLTACHEKTGSVSVTAVLQ